MRAGVIESGAGRTASRALSAADVASLHASLDPAPVSAVAARAIRSLTGARSCALWVVELDCVTAATAVDASGGPIEGFAGRRPWSEALRRAVESTRPTPGRAPEDATLVPGAAGRVVLLPLVARGTTVAVAALDDPRTVDGVEEATRNAGTALANALELERRTAELAAAHRRVERLEVLHDLGAAVVDPVGGEGLIGRLNRLLGERGTEVESLGWRSRSLAQRVGGAELTSQERALLRGSGAATTLPDGRVAVAVRSGGKGIGTMRVRGPSVASEMPFLELLAAGVAEVADRASMRADVEDAARGAALARERDRIAAGLHDTAGQLFVAIRMLARREAAQLPPASEAAARLHRLADLADHGKWEIDHAIDALALFPAARHGLAPALRSLGSSFHSEGELDVIVDVYGRPVRLPALAERALYRVVHESLANARQTRCSVVRVAVTFDGDGVHLEVADDGTCLTGTIPDRGRPGSGDMRRAVTDAGGTFHIRNAHPRGVVVEATISKEGS